MKGIDTIRWVACCCLVTVGTMGCFQYRDLVDPCYPERYEYMARKEVNAAFAPQVQNGQVLDQTVWNYQFDTGKATLNQAGIAHLAYIARRRPHPDTTVYLQTASDIVYNPEAPESMVAERQKLDHERIEAIKAFLQAQTAGRGGIDFNVVVHDPADPGLHSTPLGIAVEQMYQGFQGVLGGGGASVIGGGVQ
jgi:hypothetical protein